MSQNQTDVEDSTAVKSVAEEVGATSKVHRGVEVTTTLNAGNSFRCENAGYCWLQAFAPRHVSSAPSQQWRRLPKTILEGKNMCLCTMLSHQMRTLTRNIVHRKFSPKERTTTALSEVFLRVPHFSMSRGTQHRTPPHFRTSFGNVEVLCVAKSPG